MEAISRNFCHGGEQVVYRHRSSSCACDMVFAVFTPPAAAKGPVPALWYLSGLTCTHENAMVKGGFQAHAARAGLALVFPDTSPRGEGVADDEAYDLGQGAGFYVNATRKPWSSHFHMYDYVVKELVPLLSEKLPLSERRGITGHSMGGHGALTIAMREPDAFDSLSAFAPITNPTRSDWGRKQLSAYLGGDESAWREHDATELMRKKGWKSDLLVDQGAADDYIDLLKPESLAEAMATRRQAGLTRTHSGYDHSYFFINSFAADHVAWHAKRLGGALRS